MPDDLADPVQWSADVSSRFVHTGISTFAGMPTILEARAVTRTFHQGSTSVHAVDGADFTLQRGELTALVGPSGSGKSTFLALAGALDTPTDGSILIDGKDPSAMSAAERAELRRSTIGFVFQDLNLLPGLSAVENTAIPLELGGMSRRAAREHAAEALARVGLSDRLDFMPELLSGGERQRVAVARAVVGDRPLVVADEPTGALDSRSGQAVMELLLAAADNGAGVLIVTHDHALAAMAHRVVEMSDGSLRSGPMVEIS
jgi:putative ABC transport system ATP-binding protein